MKKTILIIFQILTLLIMSSCAVETESVEQYENDLCGALESNFDYYFSMELWNLKQIVIEAASVSSDSDAQCYHLKGKIDGVLDYSSYYCHVAEQYQTNLSNQVIPDNFSNAFYEFGKAKIDYLNAINLDIQHDRSLIASEDFKQNRYELSSTLDDMNVDITNFDEDEMNEYISQINCATELMKNIKAEVE